MKVSAASCALFAAIIALTTPPAVSQPLTTSWQQINIGGALGRTGVLSVDIDGDGNDELIIGAGHAGGIGDREGENNHFRIMKAAPEGYETVWTSPFYSGPALRQLAVVPDSANGHHLVFALLADGTLEKFTGPGMEQVGRWHTRLGDASALTVGDLGGDTPFLVAIGPEYLAGVDPITGEEVLFRFGLGGDDVAIGDVTGDGWTEIVITRAQTHIDLGEGLVLDGATGEVLWRYIGGFGMRIGLADLNGNGRLEIVGHGPDGRTRIFDASVRSPIAEIETSTPSSGHRPLLVADLAGDGTSQIVVGRGGLSVYDGATRERLWATSHDLVPGHVTGITLAHLGGVPSRLIYASDGYSLGVVDLASRSHVWATRFTAERPLFAPAFEKDGTARHLILYEFDAEAGWNRLRLRRLDLESGTFTAEREVFGGGIIRPAITAGKLEAFNEPVVAAWAGLSPEFYTTSSLDQVGGTYIPHAAGNPQIEDFYGDGRNHLVLSTNMDLHVFDGMTLDAIDSYPRGSHTRSIDHHVFNDPISGRRLLLVPDRFNRPALLDIATHEQIWRDESIHGAISFTSGDLFGDGTYHAVVGTDAGRVVAVDLETFLVTDLLLIEGQPVTGLRLAHIDGSGRRKLLIGSDRVSIYDGAAGEIEWESDRLGFSAGSHGYFFVGDLWKDGIIDVILSTTRSVHHLRGTEPYFVPDYPVVVKVNPPAGAEKAALDARISVAFSHPMAPETLTRETVSVRYEDQDLSVSLSYDAAGFILEIEPDPLWPADSEITVRLSGSIENAEGKSLDGNRNEIAEGSPIDDYVWTFTTGDGLDTVGPVVRLVDEMADTLWWDSVIDVQISVSDTGLARSAITRVEAHIEGAQQPVRLDIVPLDAGYTEVSATGTIDLLGVPSGEHKLVIRALDGSGNWSEAFELPLTIRAPHRSNWTAVGRGPHRENYQPSEGLLPPLHLLWHRDRSYLTEPPLVVNGAIYGIISRGGAFDVTALSLDTGDILWEIPGESQVHLGGLTFAYGTLFYLKREFAGVYLHAVDPETGTLRWRSPVGQGWIVDVGLTVAGRRIFVILDGALYAYDAVRGQRLWSLSVPVDGTPVVHGELLISVTDALFVGVDVQTGTEAWQKQLPPMGQSNYYVSQPLLDASRGRVYYATQAVLYAFDLETREPFWSRPGRHYNSNMVYDGSLLYILDGSDALIALDPDDGRLVSRGGEYYSRFLTGTRSAFVTQTLISTELIDRRTGRSLARLDPRGHTTFGNGRLIIGDYPGGIYVYSGEIETTVPDEHPSIAVTELYPNYPNPFNPSTTIRYATSDDGDVRLTIFDALGRRVATLQDGFQPAGSYTVTWHAGEMASGVYFCRLEAGGMTLVGRMVLQK